MQTRSKAGVFKPKVWIFEKVAASDLAQIEPSTIKQALQSPEWTQAMELEYKALQKNHTWSLVPPSSHHKVIGCKWVFKLKLKQDGSIERHKARLVAKGFHQTAGLDYFETFSPIVKPTAIRIVLSLAISFNWPIRQLDIHNAFLNGDLQEEVYMEQPPGFVNSSPPHFVCKLHKSLYGLKQSPRAWYTKLSGSLFHWGFRNSQVDTSMFILSAPSYIIIILVYVDDIIITGSSTSLLQQFTQALHSKFALKDLGDLSYFLGIQVSRSTSTLHLSQTKYINDLIKKYEMQDCKPLTTPMASGNNLSL
ncbi:hypothetical protein ACOSP7_009814 [Xanthoceras sorbifolium]